MFPTQQGRAQKHKRVFSGPADSGQIKVVAELLPHPQTARRRGKTVAAARKRPLSVILVVKIPRDRVHRSNILQPVCCFLLLIPDAISDNCQFCAIQGILLDFIGLPQ